MINKLKKNTFKNTLISVSRIKRYEQCPLSFKLNYIDKKPRCSNDALLFGSLLHAVLETLVKWVKEEEYSGIIPIDIIKQVYQEQWSKFDICGIETFNEGQSIILDYLSDKDYNCYDILDIEHEFNIEIDGYIFNGKIDLCEKINDETIRIIDYKSSRQLYTISDIDSDLQLSIYNAVAKKIWPWAKNVELELHMIRHNKIQRPSRPREDGECLNAIRYMIAVAKRTEESNNKFPPKLNSYCSYCDQCDNCEEYQNIALGKVSVYQAKTFPMDSDLVKLSDYRENLSSIVGILYKKKKDLDDLLKAKLEYEKDIHIGDLIYYVSIPEGTTYNSDTLLDTLEKFGVDRSIAMKDILDVSNIKLKKFIEKVREGLSVQDRAKLMGALAVVSEKVSETPRLNVRRNKLNLNLGDSKLDMKLKK